MKKKILVLLLVAIAIVTAFSAGCAMKKPGKTIKVPSTTITAQAASGASLRFETVYSSNIMGVYREVTTDVMYFFFDNNYSGGSGGLTVMYDPQTGGPLTYTNWKNNYQNK